jgi:hypothetical protein
MPDTVAFFRRLGFEGDVHPSADYAILTRGTVELHFFTHAELHPVESSAMCYIRVTDVEALYQAFAAAQWVRPRNNEILKYFIRANF